MQCFGLQEQNGRPVGVGGRGPGEPGAWGLRN